VTVTERVESEEMEENGSVDIDEVGNLAYRSGKAYWLRTST
jgi:hypothetical protein